MNMKINHVHEYEDECTSHFELGDKAKLFKGHCPNFV